MSDLLSGLAGLGLGDLADAEIYEEPKKEEESEENEENPELIEKDLVYDRTYECPVCDRKFTSKVMKTGKAKLIGTDLDLRPQYEGIDLVKYDVVVCPHCGFAALNRFFKPMPSVQVKLIREKISKNVKLKAYNGDIYTYDEAMERYQLALACAIVKQARAGEKAYICLKSAWLLRGMQEEMNGQEQPDKVQIRKWKAEEREFLKNAMEGFITARQKESFPVCGMDEVTLDYLISVLAIRLGQCDLASKLIAGILISPSANPRMKDKARDLKDLLKTLKAKK